MKKVGIACDVYKVKRFREELTSNGFTDFEVSPGVTSGTRMIYVNVEDDQVHDIHTICMKVQTVNENGKHLQ